MHVFDDEKISKLIAKFGIEKQYTKACNYIENRKYNAVQLKLRKPKNAGVYQFRIPKKFRALTFKDGKYLVVYKISDHQ